MKFSNLFFFLIKGAILIHDGTGSASYFSLLVEACCILTKENKWALHLVL